MRRALTSGLLPVPVGREGVDVTVHLLLSNFAIVGHPVTLQVNRIDADGIKVQIREEQLMVPAGGASRLILSDVAGERIEVNLELATRQVQPSLAVVTTAQASDTADLSEWANPDAFVELSHGESGPDESPMRLVSGLLPIGIAEGPFVPPFDYQLILLVSNFTDSPIDVPYSVQWAREVFGVKQPLEEGAIHLEPGTGGQVVLSEVAGRAVEVVWTLPVAGIVPTLAVIRSNPENGSTELLEWVARGEMLRLPVAVRSTQPAGNRADS